MLLVSVFSLLLLIQSTQSVSSSNSAEIFQCGKGGGGGSGCCRQRQQSYVQPSCGSGCQPGYSCGSYGCARRRALSGLTKRIDGIIVAEEDGEQAYTPPFLGEHLVSNTPSNISVARLTNPNFIFHACCESRGLPDACLKHCHFNTYSSQTLEKMFHKEDACPIEAANEIHFCAAQGIDHTKCCSRHGVATTLAGRKCLAFCDQRPNRFTTLDISYLPCLSVFEDMKRCFYSEIKSRAEEKFTRLNSLR